MLAVIDFASANLVWLLLALFVLALVVIGLGWLAIRKKPPVEVPPAPSEPPGDPNADVDVSTGPSTGSGAGSAAVGRAFERARLRYSFAQATRRLRMLLPGARDKYAVPWVLMLGEEHAGKSSALRSTGLDLSVRGEAGGQWPLAWWFLEQGVVLEPAGCEVLGTDDTVSERRWRRVLRQLQRHRPRRPLEAIVVTIPAASLNGSMPLVELREHAERLYRRVAEAQRVLGMRLPIYLLVSQCDQLPGFGALAGALPEGLRRTMLGWSSEYNLEAAYDPAWVDEAVGSVRADLTRLQAEIFAGSGLLGTPDQVFLLPDALEQLHEPLRIVTDALFEQSAYYESSYLRGIYFCGQATAATERGTDAHQFADPPPTVAFTHDLFANKILAESYLARPLGGSLVQRSHAVLGAQIGIVLLALAWSVGLYYAHSRLEVAADAAAPVFNSTRLRLEADRNQGRALAEKLSTGDDARCAAVLHDDGVRRELHQTYLAAGDFASDRKIVLTEALQVDPRQLSSVFMPTSWWANTRGHAEEALTRLYRDYIWRSIYVQLNAKAFAVVQDAARPVAPADPNGTIEGTAEFLAFEVLVKTLIELDLRLKQYQNLRDSKDFSGLDTLVEYAYDLQLQTSLNAVGSAIRQSVLDPVSGRPQLHRLCVAGFRGLAERALQQSAGGLFDAIFDSGGLKQHLTALDGELVGFIEQLPPSGPDGVRRLQTQRQVELVRRLGADIDRVEQQFSAGSFDWISAPRFSVGSRYDETLDALGGLALRTQRTDSRLGPSVVEALKRDADSRFQKFGSALAALRSRTLGPMLVKADKGLRLAPSVRAAGRAMSAVLEQSFMQGPALVSAQRAPPPGMRRHWDVAVLAEALATLERYTVFETLDSTAFPPAVRAPLQAVARERLQDWLLAHMSAAQRFVDAGGGGGSALAEVKVRAAAQNFAQASEIGFELLARFSQLDAGRAWAYLSHAMTYDALALLSAADKLLEGEWLYVPVLDFAGWNGKEGLGFAAFAMADRNDLGAYLVLQRDRIELLAAHYARPAVSYLSRERLPPELKANQGLVFRWRRILDALAAYQTKRPGNAIAALERFILVDLNEATQARCRKQSAALVPAVLSGDFFVARRQMLQEQLRSSCDARVEDGLSAAYARVAKIFNARLAGRFPFVAGSRRAPYAWLEAGDAQLEAMRAVYSELDRLPDDVKAVLDSKDEFPALPQQALAFLRQLEGARGFLAPWLTAPAGAPPPALPFTVDFRVERGREVGGDQIIEWRFDVDGHLIRRGDKKRAGQWQLDAPVRLTLRWATGSSLRPSSGRSRGDLAVEGTQATFEYPKGWSLLRFIRANTPESAAPAAGKGLVLGLIVPVVGKKPVAGKEVAPAQVFVRLVLLGAEGTKGAGKPISVPVFPAKAPPFDAGVVNNSEGQHGQK
jgi:type VI secretion system protein ImpL